MVAHTFTNIIHATALDPTKLTKPRQFSRSTAPAKVVDNTLWTETPAERQQRLADEVMGRKRRVENADPDQVDPDGGGGSSGGGGGGGTGGAKEDASKRRKRDAQLQRQVEEYTVRPFETLPSVRGFFFFFIINFASQANASRTVAARGSRAGRSEAQGGGHDGRARCDLGSRAGHGRRREAPGREGPAQDHSRFQGLVGQVWIGQGWKLFVNYHSPLRCSVYATISHKLSECISFIEKLYSTGRMCTAHRQAMSQSG